MAAAGKYMAISSSESFLAVLVKSKLFTAEQIDEANDAAKGTADAETLARLLVRKDMLTRWQAGQLLAGRSSFFLGKYKLIELLGRGGMGGVFLGEHTTMNRRVALKIVSKSVAKNPASLERFLTEARAIAGLDHPNIVRAYSVDNEGNRYYIVMEYVEGRDLKEIVEADGPLDFASAADSIRQACDGLAHAHDRGMIHCDIKPSNLMVNQQGVVKVLDLGLARLSDENDSNGAKEDRVLGTVDYLAPEQAMESHKFDHRADIYSLGCTLYFLLTSRPPFGEGTLHQRIVKHQTQEPPDIAKLRDDVPDDLVRICGKMMAKDPDDRFQSAVEIGRLLADWRPPQKKPSRAAPLAAVDTSSGKVAGKGRPADKSKAADAAADARRRQVIMLAVAGGVLGLILLASVVTAIVVISSRGDGDATTQAVPSAEAAKPPVAPSMEEEDVFAAEPSTEEDTKPAEKPPAEKPPAEKPPAEKPPAEKKPPAETPPAEKPPTTKPGEKPPVKKPPDKKPPVKKPPVKKPPVKKADPFRGFAKVIELPKLGDAASGNPLVLGKISVKPDVTVIVSLAGGGTAIMGKERFSIKRQNTDDGKPRWLVRYEAAASSGGEQQTDIAQVLFDKGQLSFQWLDGASSTPADRLRNCMFEINAGGNVHLLTLAVPIPMEPILVSLDSRKAKGMKRSLSFSRMPDTDALRLEVTKLEGPFPKHSIGPPKIARSGETVTIRMTGSALPAVSFDIEFKASRTTLKVDASCSYEGPDSRRRPLWKGEGIKLIKTVQTMTAMEQQANMQLPKIKDAAQKAAFGKKIEQLKAKTAQYRSLNEFYQLINGKGTVALRIFIEADGQQIDLVKTQGGGAANQTGATAPKK